MHLEGFLPQNAAAPPMPSPCASETDSLRSLSVKSLCLTIFPPALLPTVDFGGGIEESVGGLPVKAICFYIILSPLAEATVGPCVSASYT